MKEFANAVVAVEVVDRIVERTLSSRAKLTSSDLYVNFNNPFELLTALHSLEYFHSQDLKPKVVSLTHELFVPDLSLDISKERPDWEVYVVAYGKANLIASRILNTYNKFLSDYFLTFPSNLLIKRANREQLDSLSGKATYKEDGLLVFDSNNSSKNPISLLEELHNYPLNYKLEIK